MNALVTLTALAISAQASSPDQTSDARLVLEFIEAVKQGADERAKTFVASDAFIGEQMQRRRSTFADFAGYARTCKLKQVIIAPVQDGKRMPIGVKWLCSYPERERDTSFWFKGNQIARIVWGRPPVVKLPQVSQP